MWKIGPRVSLEVENAISKRGSETKASGSTLSMPSKTDTSKPRTWTANRLPSVEPEIEFVDGDGGVTAIDGRSGSSDLLVQLRLDEDLSTATDFCALYSAIHDSSRKAIPRDSSETSVSTPATSTPKFEPWNWK